jgi:crotonobetainyl-CoA:carnitine CoA-transferase CaiB-like acyl-CoA transferase
MTERGAASETGCRSGDADRSARRFLASAWQSLGGSADGLDSIGFSSGGSLPSAFPVTDLASAAVAGAALAVAELAGLPGGRRPAVTVDRRLASFWFRWSLRPIGWKLPNPWDAVGGDYRTADGWIRIHANAPRHRAAALRVLGADPGEVERAVLGRRKTELERAIIDAGGCAAEMRSVEEWATHPQGRAVAQEPLVHLHFHPSRAPDLPIDRARPLSGIRVLDLTRVLAGPVATRFLAGFGADVLRLDPPDWDEPAVVPEVTLGKHAARLDLRQAADRTVFEDLLGQAHILVHGYRPGALDALGYGAEARRALAPVLIDVSLDAFGWTGPWAGRRGFDSLVQMSSGIARAGMDWAGSDRPCPLPVQALDHATGYLIAAMAVRGLTESIVNGRSVEARCSLARTARFLVEGGATDEAGPLRPESREDVAEAIEHTPWGKARRLAPPAEIDGAPMRWHRPAAALGSARPEWHGQ